MAKIIKIENDIILIGTDIGTIKEVRRQDINFIPQIGVEVEIYETESNIIINKKETKESLTSGININVNNETKKKRHIFRNIFDVIRYLIGGFIVIGSLTDIANGKWYGFIGILFGLSWLPIVYRNLLTKLISKKKIISSLQIILPLFLSLTWGFLLPNINDSDYNSVNTNIKNETAEENVLKIVKENMTSDKILDSYELNSENNKYDFKIKYNKPELSAYVCASDNQYLAKQILGTNNIGSIQFECINSNGTFYYTKVENISVLTSNVDSNTKYFDNNYKPVNTSIETLEENHIKDFKKSCSKYSYKDVLRNPSDFQNKNAYWFGKIIQVVDKSSFRSTFRIGVNCEKYSYSGDYYCDDTIYVNYYGKESFIEDDILKMWGKMYGTETYTTVLGASITIPKFNLMYVELQ